MKKQSKTLLGLCALSAAGGVYLVGPTQPNQPITDVTSGAYTHPSHLGDATEATAKQRAEGAVDFRYHFNKHPQHLFPEINVTA